MFFFFCFFLLEALLKRWVYIQQTIFITRFHGYSTKSRSLQLWKYLFIWTHDASEFEEITILLIIICFSETYFDDNVNTSPFILVGFDEPIHSILVCGFYRSDFNVTQALFIFELQTSIESALDYSPYTILTGDINIDFTNLTNVQLRDCLALFNLTCYRRTNVNYRQFSLLNTCRSFSRQRRLFCAWFRCESCWKLNKWTKSEVCLSSGPH